MKTYLFIIFDHKGKRIGTIGFSERETLPDHIEICNAIKETFKNAGTYKLQLEA
jgi:hypothetical protein